MLRMSTARQLLLVTTALALFLTGGCFQQLTCGGTVHARVYDKQGHKLGDADLRMNAPMHLFKSLGNCEVQIELTNSDEQTMSFSGDLNADGVSDCSVSTSKSKKSKNALRTFIVIKEWGPASRTIPCSDEQDARTKYHTALTLSRNRDQVLVARISFGDGCCTIEILSWQFKSSIVD